MGAQLFGSDGVDKRLDVLAAAIRANLSALDLEALDLAYAPPYSSAKDPVNMAGFMIQNIAAGDVKQCFWDEIEELSKKKGITCLDTRTKEEYQRGHGKGFVNIPLDELRERIGELEKEKPVYVMCQSGLRSYLACRILTQNGFDCYNFSGGYRLYEAVFYNRAALEEAYPCGMEKQEEPKAASVD